MYNKAIFMGRIASDLELKTTPSGVYVLSFRIAVDRRYQAKGEDKKTDFFNVVAWRNEAEFISKYFAKGRMILVEGELQTRSYVDKYGNNAYITELVAERVSFTGEKKDVADYTAKELMNTAPAAVKVPESDEDRDEGYPF